MRASLRQDSVILTSSSVESKPSRSSRTRRGVAAAEFAILAPFLFGLVMGMFEMSRAIMVKDTLSNSARKGCGTGVLLGKAYADILTDANNILLDKNIDTTKATIVVQVAKYQGGGTTPTWGAFTTVSSASFAPSVLDKVLVTVSIPVSAVLWFAPSIMSSGTLESEAIVMIRQA
jgi:Flp pilus assembly protein TadG